MLSRLESGFECMLFSVCGFIMETKASLYVYVKWNVQKIKGSVFDLSIFCFWNISGTALTPWYQHERKRNQKLRDLNGISVSLTNWNEREFNKLSPRFSWPSVKFCLFNNKALSIHSLLTMQMSNDRLKLLKLMEQYLTNLTQYVDEYV